jgi:hypothetical protein
MGAGASALRAQQQQLVRKVFSRVVRRGRRRGFDLMRTRNNIDASTFYDIGDCIGLGSMGQASAQIYALSLLSLLQLLALSAGSTASILITYFTFYGKYELAVCGL